MTGQVQQRNSRQVALLQTDFINGLVAIESESRNDSEYVFSNIPSYFRHLVAVLNLRNNRTGSGEFEYVAWQANSDTGANYNYVYRYWDGAGATGQTASRGTNQGIAGVTATADARADISTHSVLWFYNAKSDLEKMSRCDGMTMGNLGSDADMRFEEAISHWQDDSVITSLRFFMLNHLPGSVWFLAATSRLDLYGVV